MLKEISECWNENLFVDKTSSIMSYVKYHILSKREKKKVQ